jgi:hypothetical protein
MSELKRGRKAIVIHKNELQNIIKSVEAEHKPATRSKLWELVAQTEYAKTREPRPLTAQVAMIKANELGIEITTPKGERGRKAGQGLPEKAREALRGPRKRKTVAPEVVAKQKKMFAASLHPAVDKAASGSLRAAVKLMCVDCSGGCKKEVALCQIKTCPLWAFRPYQKGVS